jgi:serine/threonine-protein kinase
MGRVYLGRQLDLGRQVVLKVMHDHLLADPKFRERFERETLLMARFQHPHAVTLYDASLNDPEGPCIVMEYIRGVTLDSLLERNGRLGPPRVGRLLGQLCEVLQAAHAEGIVHRDLKPTNLMVVDPDTPYEKTKVMDFGLATLRDPGTQKRITITNVDHTVGTPGYMCPEQARGEKMDHRGDLYSVGVVLYELLTGKLPFERKSSMELLMAHATEPPPSFAEIGAGDWASPAIERVVMACLAKDPADRPPSARDLAELYETALDHEVVVEQQSLPPEHPRAAKEDESVAPAEKEAVPDETVYELEAWMPEKIATHKLRGFVQDVGGRVVENVPGRIRVRLGGRGTVYHARPRGPLGWLLGGGDEIDVELHLQWADAERTNLLHITAVMRPARAGTVADEDWQARCNAVFCDLRAYVMGHNGPFSDAPVVLPASECQ